MEKFKRNKNFESSMKSNYLTLMFFIMIISFLSFSSAYQVDSLGEFEQNSEVRLVQICDNAEFINISSVSYPNSSSAIEDVQMNNGNNGEYYYMFNKTSEVGTYHVRGISDGCEKNFVYTFEIYPEDKGIFDFDTNTFNIILFVLMFLSGIGLIFFKQYIGSSVIFIILGFFTLVNEINILIGVLFIVIGIAVLFMNKNE